jgi:hypothetical protein
VILFFLGIVADVRKCNEGGWILGVSELGIDTLLASGDPALIYSFEIEMAERITEVQEQQIRTLADYMKPAHTHLKKILVPFSPVDLEPVLWLPWTSP